jgi:hypothetical protein
MDRRPIKYNPSGKYNLDFIDWNNEWERVGEIAAKLENGEPVSDEEEAERVRRHMEIEENKFGVNINNFEILKKNDIPINKECYICLKNFKKSDTIRKLPCGHFFCEKCIKPWLTKNSICPVCEFELKPKNNFDDNDDNYEY